MLHDKQTKIHRFETTTVSIKLNSAPLGFPESDSQDSEVVIWRNRVQSQGFQLVLLVRNLPHFRNSTSIFWRESLFLAIHESNSDGSVLDECSRKSKHLPASCKFGRHSISSPKMLQLFAKACQTYIFVSDCVAEVSRRKSCKDWSTERSRLDVRHTFLRLW